MSGLGQTITIRLVHVSDRLRLHTSASVHSLISDGVLACEVRVQVEVVKVIRIPMEICVHINWVLQVGGDAILGDRVESWLLNVVKRNLVLSELVLVNRDFDTDCLRGTQRSAVCVFQLVLGQGLCVYGVLVQERGRLSARSHTVAH